MRILWILRPRLYSTKKGDRKFALSPDLSMFKLDQKLLRKRYDARKKNVRLFLSNPGSNCPVNGLYPL